MAEEARRLANPFGVDGWAAETAGLLHDVSAVFPNRERIKTAQALDIHVLPEEERFPMILHQKISRVMAEQIFDVADKGVLSAIECHTTLKANASKLDLVLFVADKIEWDQSGVPPYLPVLKEQLPVSLEHAAYSYIQYLWAHKDTLKVIHPRLLETYRDLTQKIQ